MNTPCSARVLIADVEHPVRSSLAEHLRSAGYDVVTTSSEADMRRELETRGYQVAIVDEGFVGSLSATDDSHSRTAIILLTSATSTNATQSMERITAMCHKPVDEGQLAEIVRQLACGDAPQAT